MYVGCYPHCCGHVTAQQPKCKVSYDKRVECIGLWMERHKMRQGKGHGCPEMHTRRDRGEKGADLPAVQ